MPISEPTTLLTDYLLGVAAFALATRLAAASSGKGSWAQPLWAVAFALGAVAAFAGGTVHGFGSSLGPFTRVLLWQCALLGGALAGTLLLAGVALHTLRGGVLRLALGLVAAKAVLELVLISSAGLTRDAVWAGAVTVVLLLALALLRVRTDRATLGWLLLALVLAGAGLAVQTARPTIHPYFNHNDACHVLLMAALWPFYRVGLRLR